MTDKTNPNILLMEQVNRHLRSVTEVLFELTSEAMPFREQFRAHVRRAQQCIVQAEAELSGCAEGALTEVVMYCLARIQLAATNLNTAVAAYRAAWAST